jgi:DNA-binding CsgD family transcriptional regulator
MANISELLKKLLSKYQKYLLGIALLLSSIAISIRSSDGKINFVLHKYPTLIFIMVLISSFLVAIYFIINKRKISSLSDEIKEHSKLRSEGFDDLLNGLTERQREVHDLIISGKTNKEVMTELFIEQSTLKSHINQIYGKLNIKSRSELKSKFKIMIISIL